MSNFEFLKNTKEYALFAVSYTHLSKSGTLRIKTNDGE